MKRILLNCLTLASVLATLEHEHGEYAAEYSHGSSGLIDLGEHLDLKSEIKHDYPAGILFGHGYVSGIHKESHDELKGYGAQPLDDTISHQLISHFDKNLIAPEIPKGQIKPAENASPELAEYLPPQQLLKYSPPPQIKYTSAPTKTYEVTENNGEPQISSKMSIATPVLAPASTAPSGGMPAAPQLIAHAAAISKYTFQPPVALGSGSLGVTNLGNGNYAVGSGSLGYGGQIQQPTPQIELVSSSSGSIGSGIQQVAAPDLGSTSHSFLEASHSFSADIPHVDFNSVHSEGSSDLSLLFKER